MKNIFKRISAGLLCLITVLALSPLADAYYYCRQEVITDPESEHIAAIMADLDRQSFESEAQRWQVKEAVSYLLSESSFAALKKSPFPYMNRNAYTEKVDDGVHSYTVWAAGCYAYAKWASQVVYGEGQTGSQLYVKNDAGQNITSVWSLDSEGLKNFIRNNCQAGEHMRIDYVHSVCFIACSDEGVYFTDYAGDTKPYIRLCYASYPEFFNAVRTGSSFWLADVVSLENHPQTEPEPSPEPEPTPEPEPEPKPEPEPTPEPEKIEIKLRLNSPIITVNGESSYIDALGTMPLIRNDRTLLPIRAVIEAMGGYVEWSQAERTVSLHHGGKVLKLKIDQKYMWDEMGAIPIDSPPTIIGDRTMVPLRAVVEYFGAYVQWDGVDRSATIIYKQP